MHLDTATVMTNYELGSTVVPSPEQVCMSVENSCADDPGGGGRL